MRAKLGDVCKFYSGTGFPNIYQGQKGGVYPFYKVSDISKNVLSGRRELQVCENYIDENTLAEIRGTLLPAQTVVFAKIGEALRLNRRAITSCNCLVDNNAMGIKADSSIIDNLYFYYFMCNVDLENFCESTTVPSVRKTRIAEIEIPIPPLDEQRRIAAVLDKVSDLIAKRREQLDKLDELVKARFVEMFGDPVSNTKGLQTLPLGKVCNLKAGVTTSSDEIHDQSEEYLVPCYGGNGIRGFVKKATQNGTYPIIGRQGALCGNVQLATGEFHATEHAVLVSPLIEVNVFWIYHLLKFMDLYRYHTGAAQPGLAVKVLNSVQVPIADINQQNEFAMVSECINKSKLTIQQSLDKIETLKKALMQEYFG